MEHTKWHQLNDEELRETLGVSPQEGLTNEAAEEKRKIAGSNELSEGQKISPITLLLNQFKDFMVLVLMGATLVSGLLGVSGCGNDCGYYRVERHFGICTGVPGGTFSSCTEAIVGSCRQSA